MDFRFSGNNGNLVGKALMLYCETGKGLIAIMIYNKIVFTFGYHWGGGGGFPSLSTASCPELHQPMDPEGGGFGDAVSPPVSPNS